MKALSESGLKCVQKHLDLVRATDQSGQPKEVQAFCGWLDTVLFVMAPADQAQTGKVRERLNALFEHVIDKLYPNGDGLNAIHNGGSYVPNKPGVRC